MRQKFIISILLLLSMVAPFAAMADSFKVTPVDLELGTDGTLRFVLENPETAYYGFQAEVTLPEGLEVRSVALSDRAKDGDYRVNSNTLANGTFIMGTFSANHTAFTGTDGVLLEMTVSVSDDFKGGDVSLSNIMFIDNANLDVDFESTSAKIGVAVTGITLSPTALSLTEGETGTLTATIAPAAATDQTISWTSSDEAVATVATDGTVTAVKAGTATITATTANGKTATCTVTVEAKVIAVEAVTLNSTELNLTEEDTATLKATITPDDATDRTLTWTSSDPTVATIDNEGNVTAVKAGKATITVATTNGKTATCTVNVAAKIIEASGVTLSATTAELKVGEALSLTATVAPENTTDKTVTWTSSDEAIATVDANGKVTAIALGKATITATCGSVSAACEVTVAPTPVESITLSNATLALTEGETATLTATVNPAGATDKTITWSSSDETVATVSETGTVTAVKDGSATITATSSNGKTATCTVTVKANIITVTGISISKTEMTITEGDTAGLTATITPANATDQSVTWTSSDEAVATVSDSGEVTAIKAGTAVITAASSNGKTATCTVTVEARIIAATGITISAESSELKVGETVTLTATVAPEDATDKTVTWKSGDESIATVDANGKVTAIALGETVITATCGEVSATCKVTVVPTPVTAVTLNLPTLSLTAGDTAALTATVAPADATDKTITWSSSDEAVATVAADGTVTAVNVGTATITATSSNGLTAECVVTVAAKVIAVTGVTLDQTELNITEGETASLTATVAPEDATDKTLTWTSSDATVATVENGTVTALKAGTAIITVTTANGKSASCTVTVAAKIIEVTGVTLDKTELSMTEGDTATLTATIAPEDATDKTVTWSSSDESIATVDANGKVTAVGAGTATITATAGDKTATCTVTVSAKIIEVTGVTLDKTELSMTEGDTATLTATVAPADATDKTVTWSSSDESIATVDANGKVTAVKAGTATITAKAGEKAATCKVTVAAKVIPVESVTLDLTTATVTEGKSLTLVATVTPDNATDKTVTWSSSDTAIATVDANGKVTAVKAGTATITAKAGEKSATCVVTVEENLIGATEGNVKMTYVNMDEPDTSYDAIAAGETAKSGYNKVGGGTVGFGNTGWNVNYITYLQVDASEVEGTIIGATLTFDASGSTDSKRTTTWGVGYNSSAWSADMTYNTADKSITTVGAEASTTTKSAGTFEKLSFDITNAVKHAENGLVTIVVYETAAGGGYIKNPVVTFNWTKEATYDVTFTETTGAEGVKIVVDDLNVTDGTSLLNGTYSFTATAPHYKDYTGNFTVDGADLDVKFAMTPKDLWSYTVKNNVNDEVKTGTTYEGEAASVPYSRYIIDADGTVWEKYPGKNTPYTYTFTPEADNAVATLEYKATEMTNGILFVEAENLEGVTMDTGSPASVRSSNAAGAIAAAPVTVTTLKPGNYKVTAAVVGNSGATFTIKAGEQTVLTVATEGYWLDKASDEFTLTSETEVTFEGGSSSKSLDYILITGEVAPPVSGITLDKESAELVMGEETQLTATVTPEGALYESITWTSSNDEIATVDENGKVTATGVGNAVITAACGDFTAECAVKCFPTTGDANWDGTLDITDAVDITNFVVEKKTVADEDMEFYVRGANANGDEDGAITVSDASATVSLLLEQENAAVAQTRIRALADESADALVIGRATANSYGAIIPVTLDNSMEYVALQADIILPEGSNVEVKTGSRVADSHIMQTNKFADNHIRIALYNLRNYAIAEGAAPILEIITDSNISADDVEITFIIASDSDANGYSLASKTAVHTGVAAIGFDPEAPVKVYDMNGIFLGNTMEGLGQGTYIVRQGEESKTVRIR